VEDGVDVALLVLEDPRVAEVLAEDDVEKRVPKPVVGFEFVFEAEKVEDEDERDVVVDVDTLARDVEETRREKRTARRFFSF